MTISVNFVPETATERAPELTPIVELLQALRQARIELGEDVVVVGDGPRARLAGVLARIAGAATVRQVGASGLDDVAERSADVVVFESGEAGLLVRALRVARNLGRVLLLSDLGQIDIDVYPDLHKRSIRLIACAPDRDTPAPLAEFARRLIESGRLKTDGA
jgi:threonine dehydrogenase-like Zn-dependent dehydrogenase